MNWIGKMRASKVKIISIVALTMALPLFVQFADKAQIFIGQRNNGTSEAVLDATTIRTEPDINYVTISSTVAAKHKGGAVSETEQKTEETGLKQIESSEISPDKTKEAIEYNLKFDLALFNDYYGDYFPNQNIIAVREIESGRENYVFVGEDRTGDPHWLGNEHIFFTSYCGTACQGIYLVDTRSKESELAVLSYIYNNESKRTETYFKDWFGKEFKFEGLIDEIKSEMVNGEAYLIFNRKDDSGKVFPPKRFLFTQDSLIEVDD